MRLQPIQQLLETWRGVCRAAYVNGAWQWDPPAAADADTDAERLLCLLSPATSIPGLKVDIPAQTADYVLDALHVLGDSIEIPRQLTVILGEYLDRYTDPDGTPVFTGVLTGTRAGPVTPRQRGLDLVSSYANALTLCLAALGFLRVLRESVRREELRTGIDRLDHRIGRRLTAAMVGLLRSFAVNIFPASSPEGQRLCRMVGQAGLGEERVRDGLRDALEDTRAAMRGMTIGSGEMAGLHDADNLFECGWAWGILDGAPAVEVEYDIGRQPAGVAGPRPELYYTVRVLMAVDELFSDRTRILDLLDEEQQRLSRALLLRSDITEMYWWTVATYGSGPWPLEDLPWQTTDGRQSDYLSALLTGLVARPVTWIPLAEPDLVRLGDVLAELASRGRITRRTWPGDAALAVQAPGIEIPLPGIERLGPPLTVVANDFSPLLLRATVLTAPRCRTAEQRSRLTTLADRIWRHVQSRRDERTALWDNPCGAYPHLAGTTSTSWRYTADVVSNLVTAALVASPPRSPATCSAGSPRTCSSRRRAGSTGSCSRYPANRTGRERRNCTPWWNCCAGLDSSHRTVRARR